MQALLGGFIGAAIGFYFDATQVAVVSTKFHRYLDRRARRRSRSTSIPLLSKWGFIDLGTVDRRRRACCSPRRWPASSSWSIPAWLFAINRTFLAAYFHRETAPITGALHPRRAGRSSTQNMIEVLRWGLWMSPIIKSFLRPMGEPTWYNQDGAIRTLVAIVQDVTARAPTRSARGACRSSSPCWRTTRCGS